MRSLTPKAILLLGLVALLAHPTTAQTTVTVLPSTEVQWTATATFTSAVLDSHNYYRASHDVDDLVWNETLAEYSQDYLDSEGSGENDCPDFEHGDDNPYGENLAIGHQNATHAVRAWGDERDIYDFDDQGFDEETGHFTQMVWMNTTDVGCARKFCLGEDRDIEGWYLVCEYWPRGNVENQYEEQVFTGNYTGPPEGGSRNDDDDDDDSAGSKDFIPGVVLMVAVVAMMGVGIAL